MVAKIIASIIKETSTVDPLKPKALKVPISTNLVETALYIVFNAANIAPTAIIYPTTCPKILISSEPEA